MMKNIHRFTSKNNPELFLKIQSPKTLLIFQDNSWRPFLKKARSRNKSGDDNLIWGLVSSGIIPWWDCWESLWEFFLCVRRQVDNSSYSASFWIKHLPKAQHWDLVYIRHQPQMWTMLEIVVGTEKQEWKLIETRPRVSLKWGSSAAWGGKGY